MEDALDGISQNDDTDVGPHGPGAGDNTGTELCETCGRRLPLRIAGKAGPARRFCRVEHTWWQVDDKRISCAEAKRSAAVSTAVFGPSRIHASASTDLVTLREQVERMVSPVRDQLAANNALLEQLETIRGQLMEEIVDNRDQAQAALAEADRCRTARQVAEERTAAARAAAKAAEDRVEAAQAETTRAVAATESAVEDRLRAEGMRAAMETELRTAKDRLNAVTEKHDSLARQLAAVGAAHEADRAALATVRAELSAAADQASKRIGEHHLELERIRREHLGTLEELRAAQHHDLDAARDQFDQRLAQERANHEAVRTAAATTHADAIAALHERLGALRNAVETATQRAEVADQALASHLEDRSSAENDKPTTTSPEQTTGDD